MYYPETIVRLRATTTTDRYGSAERSWASATETTITGVQVQPFDSIEPDEVGRTRVVTRHRVLSRVGVALDLLPTDRIRWAGVDWQIVGEVAQHKRPSTGAAHHTEAVIRRVTG